MSLLHKEIFKSKMSSLHDSGNQESPEKLPIGKDNTEKDQSDSLPETSLDSFNEKIERVVNKMLFDQETSLFSDYFEESFKLSTFQIYLTRPKSKAVEDGGTYTFFVMHHGAGSCGLSFSCLAKEISLMTKGECGILTYDIRGHGLSDPILKDGVLDLQLEELCQDFVKIVTFLKEHFEWNCPIELILVGHSLGGAVISHVAKRQMISNILGCVVLDIVEGSAVRFFSMMMYNLSKRPKTFDTLQDAVNWHLKNNIIKNEQSAWISVPLLFRKQMSQTKAETKWIWRVDLTATESFWHGWFNGLSECFLVVPYPKLLILSSTDRLDKPLMIGQMQGKFQLSAFQNTGHFVHEDAPQLTAKTLLSFWKRNKKQ